MNLPWLGLGVFALATLAMAFAAFAGGRRRSDLLSVAFVLFSMWPLTAACAAFLTPPGSMLIGQLVDCVFATALCASIRESRQTWKLAIFSLLVAQAFMHVAYQIGSGTPGALPRYIAGLNATYGLQLACVFFMGARDVVLGLYFGVASDLRQRPLPERS